MPPKAADGGALTARRRLRALLVALGLAYVLLSTGLGGNLVLCALTLPWVLGSASGRRALRKRMRAIVPLLLGLWLSFVIFAAVSGSWQIWSERTYALTARVLAATLLLCWLTHDLTAAGLERALLALRLPVSFVALVMETRAFAAQLSETLHAAWAACALRGGLGSLRALRQTIGSVAGVVLLRSVDRSERVAVASALRGFGFAAAPHGEPHE